MISRKPELYRMLPGGRSEAILAAHHAAMHSYHTSIATTIEREFGRAPYTMVFGHKGNVVEIELVWGYDYQERLTARGTLRARDPIWAELRELPAPRGQAEIVESLTGRKQTGPTYLEIIHDEADPYPWRARIAADGPVIDAEMAVTRLDWVVPDPEHSTPYSVRKLSA